MPRQHKANISDVAKYAGVSVGTVSNALNHPKRVRDSLKKSVMKAIEELDYYPDPRGLALSRGTTSLIGAILFDISNPFFSEICYLLERKFRTHGKSLLVLSTDQDVENERAAYEQMKRIGVDALIICSAGQCVDQILELQKNGMPIVMFAQRSEHDDIPYVHVDDEQGMSMIARYLIEKRGLSRFCFIKERKEAIQHKDRWTGFSNICRSLGIPDSAIRVVWTDTPSLSDGYHVAATEIAKSDKELPQCFVCLNDYTAIGVAMAVKDLRATTKSDIAVTGFDNIRYSSLSVNPITSIQQPVEEMVTYIVEQIMEAIKNTPSKITSKTFEPHLVIRKSISERNYHAEAEC